MTDQASDPIRITVKPRGTIIVRGDVRVEDREGNEIPLPVAKNPGMVKFCGCGRSRTKPFCDGSHKCEVEGPTSKVEGG